MTLKLAQTPQGTSFSFMGPDFDLGVLPGFFYFSLNAEESLSLDPFNQPVTALASQPLRVYSLTLPGHEVGQDKFKAIEFLAEEIRAGRNPVENFVSRAQEVIQHLIEIGALDEERVAVGGLSRGAFYGAHLVLRDSRLKTLLGFAPMTDLSYQPAFSEMQDHPLTKELSLLSHAKQLASKIIRFYISNRDLRVSTDRCYALVREIVENSYQLGNRSPSVELFISPPIGAQGHGTPPLIFQQGSEWLWTQLAQPLTPSCS